MTKGLRVSFWAKKYSILSVAGSVALHTTKTGAEEILHPFNVLNDLSPLATVTGSIKNSKRAIITLRNIVPSL